MASPSQSSGSYCAALNCANSKKRHPNLHFFRFPKDPRCKTWVINCRRKDLETKSTTYLNANCRLCSCHFETQDFMNANRNKLVWNAIPSIFPDLPNPTPRSTSQRKQPATKSISILNSPQIEQEKSQAQLQRIEERRTRMMKMIRFRGIQLLEKHYSTNNNWSISKLFIELNSLMSVSNELCITDVDVNTRKSKLNQLIVEEREFLQKLIYSTVDQPQDIILTDFSDSTKVDQPQVIIKTEDNEDFHEGDPIPTTPIIVIKKGKSNTLLVKIPTTRSSSKRSVKAATSISNVEEKLDQDISMDLECTDGTELPRSAADIDRAAADSDAADVDGAAVDIDGAVADIDRSTANIDRSTANIDGALADKDRTAADIDRATADKDRTAADIDRATTNKDEAAASNSTLKDQQQGLIIIHGLPCVSNVDLASSEAIANDSISTQDTSTVTDFMAVDQPEQSEDIEATSPMDDNENDADYPMDNEADAALSEDYVPQGKSTIEKRVMKINMNYTNEKQLIRRKGSDFQCKECYKIFTKKMDIKKHLKSHAVDSVNLCPHCGLSFEGQTLLKKHLRLKHKKEPISNPDINDKFICGGCPRIYTNYFHLKRHRSSEHHNKEYECEYCHQHFRNGNAHYRHLKTHPRKCPYCNETFDEKVLLDFHKNQVHEDEHLQCPICHEQLKSFSDLAEHYGTHVNKDNAHVCFVCRGQFSTIDILRDHLHIHNVYRPIPCLKCPMRFQTDRGLYKHRLNSHKIVSENNGRCGGCGVIFKTISLLKKHQQIEDKVTLKPCDECTMTFTCCRNLFTHKRIKHMTDISGIKYICDFCGKLFMCHVTLKKHVKRHSKIKTYKCDVCDKSYTTDMGRKQHMASHLNLRKFLCHLCSKQYNTNVALKAHMLTHTGQRDFHCNYCDKSFAQGGTLKIHQRVHTGAIPN